MIFQTCARSGVNDVAVVARRMRHVDPMTPSLSDAHHRKLVVVVLAEIKDAITIGQGGRLSATRGMALESVRAPDS